MAPAEFVPEAIADAFREGATCVVTNCPDAANASLRKLEWLRPRVSAELAFAGKTLAGLKVD